MFKKQFFIKLLFILFSGTVSGQEIEFALPFASPTYNNPAFTGSTGNLRLQNTFKNQHAILSGNINSDLFSADYLLNNHGLGVHLLTDRGGILALSKTEISLDYAYFIALGENSSFSSGISWRLGTSSMKADDMVFGDQLQPDFSVSQTSSENIPGGSRFYTDINWGTSIFGKKWWAGLSASNLLNSELYSTNRSLKPGRKFIVQGGYMFVIGNRKLINKNEETQNKIFLDVKATNQGDLLRLQAKGKLIYKSVVGIAGISNINALKANINGLVFGAGYDYEGFSIVYGYEFFLKNTPAIDGSHELMVRFRLKKGNRKAISALNYKKRLKTFCPVR